MKKTIKIIDLLNKIANGEEVPKKIKFRDVLWTYNEENQDYLEYNKDDSDLFGYAFCNLRTLDFINDEVVILDEEGFEDIRCLENEKEFYAYTKYENYKNDIDKILYILKAINITEEKIDKLNNQINQLIKNQKKIIERLKEK